MKINLAAAALVAVIGSASFGANAQSAYFDQFENGVGSCQGALPNYEGNIRKRPLALINEGSAPAFVTCAPQQFLDLYDETFGSRVLFTNSGTTSASVTCTAVDVGLAATATYITKTATVPAGGALAALDFAGSDGFAYGSFSCSLPTNVGIYGISSYSGAEYVPPAR